MREWISTVANIGQMRQFVSFRAVAFVAAHHLVAWQSLIWKPFYRSIIQCFWWIWPALVFRKCLNIAWNIIRAIAVNFCKCLAFEWFTIWRKSPVIEFNPRKHCARIAKCRLMYQSNHRNTIWWFCHTFCTKAVMDSQWSRYFDEKCSFLLMVFYRLMAIRFVFAILFNAIFSLILVLYYFLQMKKNLIQFRSFAVEIIIIIINETHFICFLFLSL